MSGKYELITHIRRLNDGKPSRLKESPLDHVLVGYIAGLVMASVIWYFGIRFIL